MEKTNKVTDLQYAKISMLIGRQMCDGSGATEVLESEITAFRIHSGDKQLGRHYSREKKYCLEVLGRDDT